LAGKINTDLLVPEFRFICRFLGQQKKPPLIDGLQINPGLYTLKKPWAVGKITGQQSKVIPHCQRQKNRVLYSITIG